MPTETIRSNCWPVFRQLLLRQGNPRHPSSVVARQRQRHAAPAAADIQHAQVRPVQAQLGGDVTLFGDLGFLQGFVAMAEVGAGVLPVAVQEQAVQPPVQIVMMRDVAPRPRRRIVLVQPPGEVAQRRPQPHHRQGLGIDHHIADQHVEHLEQAAAFRHQRAVHIGLTHRQRRVQNKLSDRRSAG
jgi:hypothetical protein